MLTLLKGITGAEGACNLVEACRIRLTRSIGYYSLKLQPIVPS